jgi:hypothetical protein
MTIKDHIITTIIGAVAWSLIIGFGYALKVMPDIAVYILGGIFFTGIALGFSYIFGLLIRAMYENAKEEKAKKKWRKKYE